MAPAWRASSRPAFKYNQGRYAANIKLSSNTLFLFRIEFCQAYPRFKFNCRLGISRSHHLARPTPGGPEIDDDRNIITGNVLLKMTLPLIPAGCPLNKASLHLPQRGCCAKRSDGIRFTAWQWDKQCAVYSCDHLFLKNLVTKDIRQSE